MHVKVNDFLSVFAPHFESWDAYVSLSIFTKQPVWPFLLLADQEVNEETFAYLFGADEGDYTKV